MNEAGNLALGDEGVGFGIPLTIREYKVGGWFPWPEVAVNKPRPQRADGIITVMAPATIACPGEES